MLSDAARETPLYGTAEARPAETPVPA
jgi:hypothetical protein